MGELRPLPGDSSRLEAVGMIQTGDDWVLLAPGEFMTAAVESMKNDGTGWQRLVALTLPGRYNHTDTMVTVRLLMRPEDALGIVQAVAHTAMWLQADELLGGGE